LLAATPVVESNTTVSIFEGNPLKFEANYQLKCEFSKFFGGPELLKRRRQYKTSDVHFFCVEKKKRVSR
jgi:hypothetical protein